MVFQVEEGYLAPHLGPFRRPPPGHDPVLPTVQPQPWGRELASPCWRASGNGGREISGKAFQRARPPTALRGAGEEAPLPRVLCLDQVPLSPTCWTGRDEDRLAETRRGQLAARPVSISRLSAERVWWPGVPPPVRPKPATKTCFENL